MATVDCQNAIESIKAILHSAAILDAPDSYCPLKLDGEVGATGASAV